MNSRRRFPLAWAVTIALLSCPPSARGASALRPDPLRALADSVAARVVARELGVDIARLGEIEHRAWIGRLEEIRARHLALRPQDGPLWAERAGTLTAEQRQVLGTSLRAYDGEAADFRNAARLAPLRISVGRPQAQALFEAARTGFLARFDAKPLRRLLKSLRDPASGPLDAPTQADLKARRKEAAILRTAFSLLSETHEVPRAVADFARDFGHLNDAIESGVAAEIRKSAAELQKSLDPTGIERALEKFKAADRGSTRRYLERLTSDIGARATAARLPVREFHDLRKDLKQVMNLLQLGERLGSEPVRQTAYEFLYGVNEELGRMHDVWVAQGLRGEVNYDAAVLDLPAPIGASIREFLATLRLE